MRRRLCVLTVAAFMAFPMATAAAQTETPDAPDPRAQVTDVIPVILSDGSIVLVTCFEEPWSSTPPTDLFSFFYSLDIVTAGGTLSVGWEIHDGQPMAWAQGPAGPIDPQISILSGGCTLNDLGSAFIVDPISGEAFMVTANYGSWQDEETTEAVFGQATFQLESDDVVSGDPTERFGPPVFDLIGMEPIEPTTTTVPTTTTITPTTAPPTTQAAGTGGGGGAGGGAGGGGLPPWLIVLGVIAVVLGGFAAVRRGRLGPGRRQPAELGRYLVKLPPDEKQRVIREFRDLSPERKREYLEYVQDLVDYYTGKREAAPEPPADD